MSKQEQKNKQTDFVSLLTEEALFTRIYYGDKTDISTSRIFILDMLKEEIFQ